MPPTTSLTISDTDHDLGHGSRPRRHPSDTNGKCQYFHGIDDHGLKSLWFTPETLGRVRIGHRVQITTREWNDPRLGLARSHALITLDHVRAPCPPGAALKPPSHCSKGPLAIAGTDCTAKSLPTGWPIAATP